MTTTTPLQLTIDGTLDNPMVDRLQARITDAPRDTRQVLIDAAGLTDIDPVAAARLWLFCDRSERLRRRRIRIARLPAALVRRLSRHPLRPFLLEEDERELFGDPFASLAPSER